MEKLLNLLQEFYGENRKFSNENGLLTMTNGVENLSGAHAQTYIISKQGGFIKWLVENDKIDFKNNKLQVLKDIDVRGEAIYDYTLFYKADGVIMLLSISDTPIENLISYLR